MSVIEVSHVTRDYGAGRGIFDVNLSVEEGEVYGFLGPNGAGKTTTIRHLLGFIRAKEGSCRILGHDCFTEAALIGSQTGYLAGEIVFPEDMTGLGLLNFLANLRGIRDEKRMQELLDMFELNPAGRIRRMSKGMKQKLGIVSAFMGNPRILILDEPTSGLDPLMQNRFVELILQEKKKGTTILMSSHMFEEVERTCDRTAMIKSGRIAALENMESLHSKKSRRYVVTLAETGRGPELAEACTQAGYAAQAEQDGRVSVTVSDHIPEFLKRLSQWPVQDLTVENPSLEELFLHYYGGDEK